MAYSLKLSFVYKSRPTSIPTPIPTSLIRGFTGQLRQRDVKLLTSETVISEAYGAIIKAVNNLCETRGITSNAIRYNLVQQAQRNSQTLQSLLERLNIDCSQMLKEVDSFYSNMSNDPRLIELRNKKGPNNPGVKDKKILAESCQLALSNDLYFLTGDTDFATFSDEIYQKFNVQILPIIELVGIQNQWGWLN